MNELVKLKDGQLLEKFGILVRQEREAVTEVILHLSEIDRRKLYAAEGYSSLFSYCVEKYHYSESAAYRRIQTARIYPRFPEILKLLKEGKLNLVTLSLLEPHLDHIHGKALMDKALGKSKRAVEELLSELSLKKEKTQDIIRRLPIKEVIVANSAQKHTTTGGSEKSVSQKEPGASLEMSKVQEIRRVKIEFVADEGVAKLIERAKELLRHKYPQGKLEDLVREAFELLLEKKDPQKKIAKLEIKKYKKNNETMEKAQTSENTRYIPRRTKLSVWKRDTGECSYKSPDGKKCGERAGLEIDHIKPFSLGGKSSVENLRLLCRTHNQWRAIQTFGNQQTSMSEACT